MGLKEGFRTYWNTRLAVGAVVIFLASAFASCTELKYAIWGRTAEATVVGVKKSQYKSRGGGENVLVSFGWTEENGAARKDEIRVGVDSAPAQGDALAIDYLPGVKGSRPAGRRNYVALTIFGVASAAMLFVFVKLFREGSR